MNWCNGLLRSFRSYACEHRSRATSVVNRDTLSMKRRKVRYLGRSPGVIWKSPKCRQLIVCERSFMRARAFPASRR